MAPSRIAAMRGNIEERLRHEGLGAAGRDLVLRAYDVAMEHRLQHIDEEHPDALHPGRTVRILLDDALERSAIVLAAGMLIESWEPAARPPIAAEALTGARPAPRAAVAVATLVADVPLPPSETLLEDLVVATPAVRRIAVAEAFDHARHLHQHPSGEWAPRHHLIDTVYRPAASRSDAGLAARLDWWCDMFRRRFLNRPARPLRCRP